MRVFVTGASGFIGQALTEELLAAGHQVLGLARSDASAATLEKLGADVQRGELADLDSLKEGARAADGVVHLGFGVDFADIEGMCRIDRAAITAMASVMEDTHKPLVVPTGTLMLAPGHVGTEADGYDTTSAFASIRGQSETLVHSLTSKNIRGIIVRFAPTVHGDGDRGLLNYVIQSCKAHGAVAYVGDGANRWPAVHRLDVARLLRLALENGPAGATFHGVAEPGIPWKDIADSLAAILHLPTTSLTFDEAQGHYGWLAGPVATDNPASNTLTRDELGWEPEHIGLLADIRDRPWYASL